MTRTEQDAMVRVEGDLREHLQRHLTDGCWHDSCGYCSRRRVHGGGGVDRPYCLRCEVPIFQDEHGVWRREATGVDACPRNPAGDGHEPHPT